MTRWMSSKLHAPCPGELRNLPKQDTIHAQPVLYQFYAHGVSREQPATDAFFRCLGSIRVNAPMMRVRGDEPIAQLYGKSNVCASIGLKPLKQVAYYKAGYPLRASWACAPKRANLSLCEGACQWIVHGSTAMSRWCRKRLSIR